MVVVVVCKGDGEAFRYWDAFSVWSRSTKLGNEWRFMKYYICNVCVYAMCCCLPQSWLRRMTDKLLFPALPCFASFFHSILLIYPFCALALQYCIVNVRPLVHNAFTFTTLQTDFTLSLTLCNTFYLRLFRIQFSPGTALFFLSDEVSHVPSVRSMDEKNDLSKTQTCTVFLASLACRA